MSASEPRSPSAAALGFVAALAALGFVVATAAIPMRIGSLTEPGAGFFPFVGGAVLFALAILDLLARWMRPAQHDSSQEQGPAQNWRAYALTAALGIYVFLLGPLGFVISTFLLACAVLRIATAPTWPILIGCGVAASLGSYLLFDRLLGVSLPKGLLAGVW